MAPTSGLPTDPSRGAAGPGALLGDRRGQLRELFDRDRSAVAEEGLKRTAELYAAKADLEGQPPEVRRVVHQSRAKPLVKDLGVWLAGWRAKLSAKSGAGEKLAFFANHWGALCVYLADGRVQIDSNAVETDPPHCPRHEECAVRRS